MTVWIVGVLDCEYNDIKSICATKEIAERELFKARDELVAEWRGMKKGFTDDMYEKMIAALSGSDYNDWNNYPHDEPYLYETEVIEN